ncbi:MAG: hypothetical protein RL021_2011 [Bacteroidota bacterium]
MKKKIILAVIAAGVTVYACEKESLFSDTLPGSSTEKAIVQQPNDVNALQVLRPRTIAKDGNESLFSYDKNGALTAIESPLRKDLFTRDGHGRVTEWTAVIMSPIAESAPGLSEKRTRYVFRYVGEEIRPRTAQEFVTEAGSTEKEVANIRYSFNTKNVKTGEWIEDLRTGVQTTYEYGYDNYNRLLTVVGTRNGARIYYKKVNEFFDGHSATAALVDLALEPGTALQRGNPSLTTIESATSKAVTLKCHYVLNDYHQPVRISERDNTGYTSESTIIY